MPTKLLRPNVGIYVATSDAFANWAAPTLTEITNNTKVFNISQAVADNYTLNMTDSDVDNSLSMVDAAQVNTPTLYNYEASLDGFRDASLSATSVYNKFRDLFTAGTGTKYYLIKRVGKAHDAAFVAGDLISIFGVTLDNPVDIVADGAMIMLGARFLTTGEVKVNIAVGAGTAGSGPALATTVGTKMQSNANLAVYWVPAASVANETTFLAGPSAATVNGAIKLTNAIAWDGYELGATDSNKIDDKGIADAANSQSKGFSQFAGSLTFFRGKFPTSTQTVTNTSGQATLTLTNAANFVEVGMAVSGTGVPAGTTVLSVSGNTITMSANSTSAVSSATFVSDYSLAYDTFRATTGTRPAGYLVTRIGAGTGSIASGDKVNVFKFIADAAMDNTEGEDSVKFMTKFQPQGLLSLWATATA